MRCFNNNTAGPFGSCVALQQTDITPNANTPQNINTAATADAQKTQINNNLKDLSKAQQGLAAAPNTTAQGVGLANAILGDDSQAQATAP